MAAVIVVIIGATGWQAYHAFGNIFHGNAFAIFGSGSKLKTDSYGRTNILLFGTSEDDPNHPGGDLTDSIMIVSVDQSQHNAVLASVPRDLWVRYGRTCPAGSAGKINALYSCVKDRSGEDAGQAALRDTVGNDFGINIPYSVHVNFEVLRNSVNAVGGIDTTISSPDPRGIMDRNFDWRCNYRCFLVKYPNGPVHLNGDQALYLAQARGEGFGYGLPRGNFDREANQRKILIATKQKATSVGFLANPVAVNKLLDSLGNNVRTNISASEAKTFIKVIKDTDSAKIQSLSLIDQKPVLLTTGPGPDGSSIVRPVAGLYDYSDLSVFMQAKFKALVPPPATKK